MKISSRVGAVWAIAVFLVVGAVLVLVVVANGGDETDMEQQPESAVRYDAGPAPSWPSP